jgi:hypothetical protein
MMSKLTRLHDEATRLLTVYEEHRDNKDESMRRKAHVDLDRFLMENREIACILMVQGLQDSIDKLRVEAEARKAAEAVPTPWYKKLFGGAKNAKSDDSLNQASVDNVGQ